MDEVFAAALTVDQSILPRTLALVAVTAFSHVAAEVIALRRIRSL